MKSIYFEKFKKQLDFLNKNLTENEKTSIRLYSSSEYYSLLNESLREGTALKKRSKEQEIYNNLMNIFSKVPPLENPIQVYRGVKNDNFNTKYLKKQFVSTTLDREISKEFSSISCCTLFITIPSGTQCLPIYNFSENSFELEVVLPPGLKWVMNHNINGVYDLVVLRKDSIPMSEIKNLAEIKENTPPKINEKKRVENLFDDQVLEFMYDNNIKDYSQFLIDEYKVQLPVKTIIDIIEKIK